jgi:hypothetical protein
MISRLLAMLMIGLAELAQPRGDFAGTESGYVDGNVWLLVCTPKAEFTRAQEHKSNNI